jgi:hypothetical protein
VIRNNPELLAVIPVAAYIAFVIWVISRIKRAVRNAAMPKCQGLPERAYKSCVRKYEIEALQKQIKNLEKARQLCVRTDNPPKCNLEIDKKIQKLRDKLNKKLAEDRSFSGNF